MRGEAVVIDGVLVDNVLVEVGQAPDTTDIALPVGTYAQYTLRLPITAPSPIHDAKVTVRGETYDTLNYADHWRPQAVFDSWSNDWDMTLLVGRSLGDFVTPITIVELIASVDELGDAVTSERVVFDGNAQARRQDTKQGNTTTSGTAKVTDVREAWTFVVPWVDSYDALDPAAVRIKRENDTYRVSAIINADQQSEWAAFEAVLDG